MPGNSRSRTTSITIPVSGDVLDALDALAKREKVDRTVLARHLLLEALQTRTKQGRA